MCGIVGYIGNKNTLEILLKGLETLEYRGYDSAGIVLTNKEENQIVKTTGRIKDLREKTNNMTIIDSNKGIGHTRWATHGGATEENAHPHQVGRITLVHNGIIENADELRIKLKEKGYQFKSETDTEVAAALIDSFYQDDMLDAINEAKKVLIGSYAFAIICEDNKDIIYTLRKDSPLTLGIGENENFLASDICALIDNTNKYIYLSEGNIAIIKQDVITIYNSEKELVEEEIKELDITSEAKSKMGYPHYMLKEMLEEPVVLEQTLKPYLENMDSLPDLSKYEQIHIVACGSAMYAGMVGKTLIEEYANVSTLVEVASEYRYKKNIYDRKTLVILISQSGETADTIAAMRYAKDANIDTLAIVNVKTSTIAREADQAIFIEAGSEIAVATTKAYLLQVAILSLLAMNLAKKKGLIENPEAIMKDYKNLPRLVKEVLDRRNSYKKIAQQIYEEDNIFFIGRKIDYAISMEGSLKLKEISYIHSEAYQAGELKHGTISLIEEGMPVFGIITDKELKGKTLSNLKEVEARGAKTILITTDELKEDYPYLVTVPTVSPFIQPMLVVPVLQMIAYETANLRGCDIDKPRNLAKSVTVE